MKIRKDTINKVYTVGSVCSGIEAASVAWRPLSFKFEWFSGIGAFPSELLKHKYPFIENVGDMTKIPSKIKNGEIIVPDIICGGTPCQAYSLAGQKKGLDDNRGNLTLKFVDVIDANDEMRIRLGLTKTIVFWENVEGVLTDKTNAFGCFISALAGLPDIMENQCKWPKAGILRGSKRNVAWRVLDAKYFGVPQQRRRLYLIASGKDILPENILFEEHINEPLPNLPNRPLSFIKGKHTFEIFRGYTDCLYSSYGTKWNGNAAANNGSLFVVQDGRLRRLSPLECERLMGLPDNYTQIEGAKRTNRYQAIGNSWTIPVIEWIGKRIQTPAYFSLHNLNPTNVDANIEYYDFNKGIIELSDTKSLNCSIKPENCKFRNMINIVEAVSEDIFISPTGCSGILRRANMRNQFINQRLKKYLIKTINTVEKYNIEK
ncbi:DNA cytosine methyltransferase [Holdemanella biformis]